MNISKKSYKKFPKMKFHGLKSEKDYESNDYTFKISKNGKYFISSPCKFLCHGLHCSFIDNDFKGKFFDKFIENKKKNERISE